MVESEDYKRNVDRQEEMLSRNMDAAARMKKIEDQLRRTTRDFQSRSAKFTEVDCGFFENVW
jgi:hypothetical protein